MNIKKKAAIITFHNSHNCGSMLQALALQNKLEQYCGVEVTMIDFSSEGQMDLYSIFPRIKNIKDIVKNLLFIPYYKKLKMQQKQYNEFMEHFNLSSTRYTSNFDLEKLNGQYDYWVCGSDQIWNISCPDADDAYFLDFVYEGKKIAYAPSFGGVNACKEAENANKYIDYLRSIDHLSIREFNGKKWIEDVLPSKIPVIPDPTLLFGKNGWDKYSMPGRIIEEDYLFYYAFHYNKEQNALVTEIAKRKKLKIIVLDVKSWIIRGLARHNIKLSPQFGPAAFLNLISNATMVLTRSFHGAVFSIIYEKPFWYLGRVNKNTNGDDRAMSLLTQLEIFERSMTLDELRSGEKDVDTPVNYDLIKKRIVLLRKEAEDYLKDAFKD